MQAPSRKETFIEQTITYPLEVNGTFTLIENVPVRTNVETGEQLFAPETAARLQQLAWDGTEPARLVQVPVLDFTA